MKLKYSEEGQKTETTESGVVSMEGKDLNTLIKNYMEYKKNYYEKNKELFRKLAEEGQKPKVFLYNL